MSNRDDILNYMIKLIVAWHDLRNTEWPAAKAALEEKINALGKELFHDEV